MLIIKFEDMNESLVYLSLGSNLGNKIKNIQEALNSIDKFIGDIFSISKIYENPAIGFKGDDFLNCCISVQTELSPHAVLKKLLEIEIDAGRRRLAKEGYESRKIDIDILFYNDIIINDNKLKIPHKKLHDRKFVIRPLLDIAKSKIHPVLKITVDELSKSFRDFSDIKELNESLQNPVFGTLKIFNSISIEGNIGVGKTSFATKLSKDLNKKLILESFYQNPYLKKFYEKPDKYALNLELTFLVDRCKELYDLKNQPDLFKSGVVFDYHVQKSLIFAGVTLSEIDFNLYRNIYYLMTKDLIKPDLTIFLMQSSENLISNIRKRDRPFEKSISPEYLIKIEKAYKRSFQINEDKFFKIDVSNLDYVESNIDYMNLIFKIKNILRKRLEKLPNYDSTTI